MTQSTDIPVARSGSFLLGGDRPVYRLGFGAMRLTGKGIWGEPGDPGEAIAVLRRAVELGINLIDTADSYGPAVSERLIAEALHPYPPELVIATKGGLERPGPDQWTPNGRPEHLRAACEGSLRRLKLERIELYQLHRIDPAVPFEDQIGTLEDLQAQGKIRHIGLSEVSVADIERARKLVPIVSVQNRYNLVERRAAPASAGVTKPQPPEQVLAHCERQGIAFIPWFPLFAGDLAKPRGPLARMAKRLRATPAQVALAWLLKRSPVMLPIPGTSSVQHLEENVGAALLELSDRDFQELDRA
ncbi:MAG TPA: aldo/keto reductase [Gemmatimonadales bacterium]|nr:aldo/keto reductase [Gemmatimonadales bacterium]